VGPIQSHESLKAENFSWLVSKRCDDRRIRDVVLLALKMGRGGHRPRDAGGP